MAGIDKSTETEKTEPKISNHFVDKYILIIGDLIHAQQRLFQLLMFDKDPEKENIHKYLEETEKLKLSILNRIKENDI